MKLIIDMPEETKQAFDTAYSNDLRGGYYDCGGVIGKAIQNGTPLDDVRAEIAEEICLTNNPYTKETKYTIEHIKLLEIFDNIGKAESEGPDGKKA